jgi:hypothetical protein
MNPRETLINLFAALAITVIAQPIAQAHAGDFLEDVFGTEQPAQKAPFDQAADACVKKVPVRATYEQHMVFTHCLMNHPQAANYAEGDNQYLLRMLDTEKQVLAGKDYTEAKLEEKTWRQAQLNGFQRQIAAANEQRRLANAVENIPLQQAMWANTIQGINESARTYTPRMFINRY